MAVIKVNPTRMELTKMKKRNQTARRGHKLLKDKRDEMVKQFLELVRRDRALRKDVEESLARMYSSFDVASSRMSETDMTQALICPKQKVSMTCSTKNVMSVDVPRFDYEIEGDESDVWGYGFAFTVGELDDAVGSLCGILPKLVELAETEKAVMLLAAEIEKTRRRVNALEYVMIPDQMDTIKYILDHLDENERSNTARLMKLKTLK